MIGGSHAKRLSKALSDLGGAKQPDQRLDAARQAGLTWAEIGAIYGLTKQGAQQRFRAGRAKGR